MDSFSPSGSKKLPDLLCFSHLRWDFVFQRPQHLMTRFAKERRVFYIEEPVFKEDGVLWVARKHSSGVHFVRPHLPSGLSEAEVNAKLREVVDEVIAAHRIRKFIAWYYTPMALPFTRHLIPIARVYDCMDELANFKNAPATLKRRERELCERSHLIFTGGQSLYEAKAERFANAYPFPSSVDVAHFSKARNVKKDRPDQAPIPHPRIGFFGVIDERMDLELIDGVAQRRPDWHLVLLGPVVKIDPAALPQRPNIHYLGMKDYAELPEYLGGWDVAMLPFARNEATRFISPTKTPEYMAGGRPVVSTSIRDVVRPYGEQGLARIADDPDSFVAAVQEALSESPEQRLAKADAFLQQISWDKTWLQMKVLLDRVVAKHEQTEYVPEVETSPTSSTSAARIGGARRFRTFDYLVVGAGFAGSVIAERLAVAGKKVLICDKRPHVGGNAYDHYDDAGILVHKYGPHIFHTNSADVFNYLSRFTEWYPYEHRVLASVDGKLLPIPINLDTVNKLYGWNLSSSELEVYFNKIGEPRDKIRTSEDVIISKVGRELYEKFFRNYTLKQWGLDPSELDSSVIARIPVRTNCDDRYFTDTYQAMPLRGYTRMFENMLDHKNITVELGTDYQELVGKVNFKEMVYSGPVDAFFNHCYGKLPYRSLEFKFESFNQPVYQAGAVINYPNEHAYTRITEFKYLTGQEHQKTSIVSEFPRAEGDPYYPIPKAENAELYKKYQQLAQAMPQVHFVGRLATYKYYNMDQVVGQALTLACKLGGVDRKQLLEQAARKTWVGAAVLSAQDERRATA